MVYRQRLYKSLSSGNAEETFHHGKTPTKKAYPEYHTSLHLIGVPLH